MQVENVTGYAVAWRKKWNKPWSMQEDLIQEAWLAALEHNNDAAEISQALNRYCARSYATPMSESCFGTLPHGVEIRLSMFPEESVKKRIRCRK